MLGEVVSTSWENMPGSIFLSDNVVNQAADFLIITAKVLIRTSKRVI